MFVHLPDLSDPPAAAGRPKTDGCDVIDFNGRFGPCSLGRGRLIALSWLLTILPNCRTCFDVKMREREFHFEGP